MRARLALCAALLAALGSATGAVAEVRRVVLANGVTVLVREERGSGVVAAGLHVRMAPGDETTEMAGITNLLQRAMLRGTARRPAQRIVEAAEEIGGGVDASGDAVSAEIAGTALARHWEALLELIAEIAQTPSLPGNEIDKERRLALSRLQSRGDSPQAAALDRLRAELYGAHPYGAPPLGRREVLERLTRDDLVRHHAALYRPDRLVLAMSGDLERARALKVAERLLGRLPAQAPAPRETPAPARPSRARLVIERPAQQAHIVVGYLVSGVGTDDYPATRVLGAILGGGTTGRLFVELREKLGLAYSVGVLAPWRLTPAYLVAYIATAGDNAASAEERLRAEIARIRNAGATDFELARAKAYLTGTLLLDRRTNARHTWHLGFFEAAGVGWDYPDRYARAVEAVTLESVQRAAQQHLVEPTTVVLQPTGR
ncbi:MAG: insulinase family protein [Candidatus Rokubacteria bacterium]|nr:insulinase family protein [Candidatus Rokubacteria bacterium]MBI3827781.1 insulinase family protein [Candidatus Rokubacteria bacterium]